MSSVFEVEHFVPGEAKLFWESLYIITVALFDKNTDAIHQVEKWNQRLSDKPHFQTSRLSSRTGYQIKSIGRTTFIATAL